MLACGGWATRGASSRASIREGLTVASAINRMVTVGMLNKADHTYDVPQNSRKTEPEARACGAAVSAHPIPHTHKLIASFINIGARSWNTYTSKNLLFQNEFTNVFNAQNFSVLIPANSGLVLNLGATDYFLGHLFQFCTFI